MADQKLITHKGITDTHRGWSRRLGGSKSLIQQRLASGWSEKDAVSVPVAISNVRKRNEYGNFIASREIPTDRPDLVYVEAMRLAMNRPWS